MPEVQVFHLSPTRLVPNSPYPLLFYPGVLATAASDSLDNGDNAAIALPLAHARVHGRHVRYRPHSVRCR